MPSDGFPEWITPMLATLTEERFSHREWVFEPKLDGYRCLAYSDGKNIRLMSRNQLSLNTAYPGVARALTSRNGKRFIVDGEIVAFKPGSSISSFSALQQTGRDGRSAGGAGAKIPVFYYVFDLLYWDNQLLTRRPLLERKALLQKALRFNDTIHYVSAAPEEGETYFAEACRLGWEGLIAKRAESKYLPGRSAEWLKFKCMNEEEFVIGGFTDPENSRIGFGALLMGFYEKDRLIYSGKVGTGFNATTLRSLAKRLKALEQKASPFGGGDPPRKGVHWVTPKLVAQLRFAEWTDDGKARHPSFLGLRADKNPTEVLRPPLKAR